MLTQSTMTQFLQRRPAPQSSPLEELLAESSGDDFDEHQVAEVLATPDEEVQPKRGTAEVLKKPKAAAEKATPKKPKAAAEDAAEEPPQEDDSTGNFDAT